MEGHAVDSSKLAQARVRTASTALHAACRWPAAGCSFFAASRPPAVCSFCCHLRTLRQLHIITQPRPCSAVDVPPTPGKEEVNDIGKVSSGSEQSDEEAGAQQVRAAMLLPLCLVSVD